MGGMYLKKIVEVRYENDDWILVKLVKDGSRARVENGQYDLQEKLWS